MSFVQLRAWVTHNWALKLTALALSVALWFAVRAETITRGSITNVPVVVDLTAEGWVLSGPPSPDTVEVEFEGPVRELVSLGIDPPRVLVSLDAVDDTVITRPLELRLLDYERGERPDATRPVDIRPSTVSLRLDRIVTRLVPVAVPLAGRLPEGLRLLRPPAPDPARVSVSGPSRRVNAIDSIRVAAIDLGALTEDAVVEVPLDTAALAPVGVAPARVTVRFTIGADGEGEPGRPAPPP
ncbi:MAG TPA: YbbR-like domain-containing protein [Longimicrobiales bacterium]|nr:YbbR-like domain-containing protein [Longimicrobiales bacterium]